MRRFSVDNTVVGGPPQKRAYVGTKIRRRMSKLPFSFFKTDNPVIHSVAWPGYGLADEINRSDIDIVHLHWLGNNTLSVEEIGRLKKPILWTLHDMWGFCGAEHYVDDTAAARFRHGYTRTNRTNEEHGWDVNRWVWRRKKRSWKVPMKIVCPSRWLSQCATTSALFRSYSIETIPYPLDLSFWRPVPKHHARSVLRLPMDAKIILFGAMGGLSDARKGADLLFNALDSVDRHLAKESRLVIFGEAKPSEFLELPLKTNWFGYLQDDISLVMMYSAADVFVLPSRQDNLPNTAIEALACSVPVVAFRVGGLCDIVEHQENGWLAQPFDSDDLARGIEWVLKKSEYADVLGRNARNTAEQKFKDTHIAERYRKAYESLIHG